VQARVNKPVAIVNFGAFGGAKMSTTQQIFDQVKTRLTKDKAKKINASYFFDIGGNDGGKWHVDLTKDGDWVTQTTTDTPAQCMISVPNGDDWVAIATGKLNATMAFMQGKVKVKGDMSLAMKLQTLLS